jgi:hypothetical protein
VSHRPRASAPRQWRCRGHSLVFLRPAHLRQSRLIQPRSRRRNPIMPSGQRRGKALSLSMLDVQAGCSRLFAALLFALFRGCSRRRCAATRWPRARARPSPGWSTARSTATAVPASPASPISAATATGPGRPSNQANWYAFGRFAWDPEAASDIVAREWAAVTFAPRPALVDRVATMMAGSREAVVDYMTPLGLAHQTATGHHYGPGPWIADLARPEWNPVYYSHADKGGIGFDRTASGSDAIGQYAPGVARMLADPAATPERDLLWFHHVACDARAGYRCRTLRQDRDLPRHPGARSTLVARRQPRLLDVAQRPQPAARRGASGARPRLVRGATFLLCAGQPVTPKTRRDRTPVTVNPVKYPYRIIIACGFILSPRTGRS